MNKYSDPNGDGCLKVIAISCIMLIILVFLAMAEWQDHVNSKVGYDVCKEKPKACQ